MGKNIQQYRITDHCSWQLRIKKVSVVHVCLTVFCSHQTLVRAVTCTNTHAEIAAPSTASNPTARDGGCPNEDGVIISAIKCLGSDLYEMLCPLVFVGCQTMMLLMSELSGEFISV